MRKTFMLFGVMTLVFTAGTAVLAQEPEQEAPAEVAAEEPAPAVERVLDGLVALYLVEDVQADGILPDRADVADPLDLTIRSGAVGSVGVMDDMLVFGTPAQAPIPGVFSERPAREIIRAIKANGKFTIETWVCAGNLQQTGPARIVSISRNSAERNVTLAQHQSTYVLRLRTTETNLQGIPELSTPENSVSTEEWQHLVVTFDGYMTRMYINGEVVAESPQYAGMLTNWDEELHLILGNEFDGGRQWNGLMETVAIYADALTAEQVQTNFQAGF